MDFDYLCEVPVLTLDVNDDFKGDKFKCADMIEKVVMFFLSFPVPRHVNVHTKNDIVLGQRKRWLNGFKMILSLMQY